MRYIVVHIFAMICYYLAARDDDESISFALALVCCWRTCAIANTGQPLGRATPPLDADITAAAGAAAADEAWGRRADCRPDRHALPARPRRAAKAMPLLTIDAKTIALPTSHGIAPLLYQRGAKIVAFDITLGMMTILTPPLAASCAALPLQHAGLPAAQADFR